MTSKVNIEEILDYTERLDANSKAQTATARQYLAARKEYAKYHFKMQMEIARNLAKYEASRKNIGVDKAMLLRLQEAELTGDQQFINDYEAYLMAIATYKGLGLSLEALQSQSIGIQSIMKWTRQGDTYGSVD